MTADELQRIVLRLANSMFVRYYIHVNYPNQSPWLMAIQVMGYDGESATVHDMERNGFEWDDEDRYYFVDRTDEEGEPYRSPL